MNDANEKALQAIRLAVRDNKKVATVSRFRPALSALHRASLQRRAEQRRVSADHLRRRQSTFRSRPEIYFWRRQSRAGARRFRRACRTRPPRFARASWQRCCNPDWKLSQKPSSRAIEVTSSIAAVVQISQFDRRSRRNAAWNDRARADGRQHGAPASEKWPHLCGV